MATAPATYSESPASPAARRFGVGDRLGYLITIGAASSIFLITCLLVYNLWADSSLPRHKFGWHFLTTSVWDPNADQFGAVPFAYGTVMTALVALIISVPIGVGAAVFLSELAPRRISDALTFMIELLAAVPSVIYGLLGIFILVPFLQSTVVPGLKQVAGFLPIFDGPFYGYSIFSASIVLSLMIVPFIISVSREVLLGVPSDQREAALALGSTKWESTWKIVVPFALRGIFGSIFLALARALGETMAVTMVVGNTPQIKASLLAPGYSIAAVIANEFAEATSDLYQQSLIEMGLVLFAITIIINALARLLILTTSGGAAGKHA